MAWNNPEIRACSSPQRRIVGGRRCIPAQMTSIGAISNAVFARALYGLGFSRLPIWRCFPAFFEVAGGFDGNHRRIIGADGFQIEIDGGHDQNGMSSSKSLNPPASRMGRR